MRDRLIELLDNYVYDDWRSNQDIADYLLENGVIGPPCKVGDTVFVIPIDALGINKNEYRPRDKTASEDGQINIFESEDKYAE